jgi:hypothetical protein
MPEEEKKIFWEWRSGSRPMFWNFPKDQQVQPGTWMADNDVGEMFLNFVLHESVQALCGVDLTKYFP